MLSRHMKSRDSLAVGSSTKRTLQIDVRAMVQQPRNGFQTIARRSPDESGAPIRIGIQTSTRSHQPVQHSHPVTLTSPHERLVEYLLRIRRRSPVRETTMRTVEASGGASFRCERSIGTEAGIHQLRNSEPGSSPKISRSHGITAQQLSHFTMPPE